MKDPHGMSFRDEGDLFVRMGPKSDSPSDLELTNLVSCALDPGSQPLRQFFVNHQVCRQVEPNDLKCDLWNPLPKNKAIAIDDTP